MSKSWYPVIDIEKCIECGVCVEHCKHGVYNKEKAPVPVVFFEEGCVQGCTGCSKKCPVGAISYVGSTAFEESACGCGSDKKEDSDCGCGCGSDKKEDSDCA